MEGILWLERVLWSGPLLLGLMGSHVYFTVKLRGIQRLTVRGIRLSLHPGRAENGISSFGALATSLAAAIGTGNIIGVATAVALGGPGAVFWCWLTGVFGMATRYAESFLSLRYRRRQGDAYVGGPMYVLSERLNMPRLGRCFALFGVAAAVGTGSLIQANAIGATLYTAADIPLPVSGTMIAVGAALVILGGVQSISKVCEKLVPVMSALYIGGCLAVLWWNRSALPAAIQIIVSGAFAPRAAGGGFVGSTILTAARFGTARGLFTNESGMGTAPLAAVSAPGTAEEEALISMTGVFWDTVVICAMTGLALVSAMVGNPAVFAGAGAGSLCYLAFSSIPLGGVILTVSLSVFAFATIVGWCWYGECSVRFLWGERIIFTYRACYLAAAFCGVFGSLACIWSLGGILAGLMAVPNLVSLWLLRREIGESVKKLPLGEAGSAIGR